MSANENDREARAMAVPFEFADATNAVAGDVR
jgi:hypothetical protein